METNKEEQKLGEAMWQGDQWLIRYGYVAPQHHNFIIMAIHEEFPEVKQVEYFVSPDPEQKAIDVTVNLGFWKLFFMRKKKFTNKVLNFLGNLLPEHDIRVRLGRYSSEGQDEKTTFNDTSSTTPS